MQEILQKIPKAGAASDAPSTPRSESPVVLSDLTTDDVINLLSFVHIEGLEGFVRAEYLSGTSVYNPFFFDRVLFLNHRLLNVGPVLNEVESVAEFITAGLPEMRAKALFRCVKKWQSTGLPHGFA